MFGVGVVKDEIKYPDPRKGVQKWRERPKVMKILIKVELEHPWLMSAKTQFRDSFKIKHNTKKHKNNTSLYFF